MNGIEAFLAAAVRTATPLLLAATGELVAERAGIIFIGLEGAILAGALGAAVGAHAGGPLAGIVAGIAAGALVGAAFAFFVVRVRTEQIVTGTAIMLLAAGATAALYHVAFGTEGAGLRIPTVGELAIPGLAALPLVGRAFFAQSGFTYAAVLIVVMVWWWLTRTHAGLALRACGERLESARAAGIPTSRYRFLAATWAGALGGGAGAALVLAQAGTFAEGMSAGRGFIAIAVVALGRWSAPGVLLAAGAFGATSALQFLFQARGWALPYQAFLAIPYVATLLALATSRSVSVAPASLGRSEDEEP